MDGTLLRTDMTFTNLCWVAGQKPLALLQVPQTLTRGRNALKAYLAETAFPPVLNLPLNESCVGLIQEARAQGRPVILASASDERIVEAVARETDLFDTCYGSDHETNLKGTNKAAFLAGTFGQKGFDYVGDSKADLSVWRAARRAYTVNAAPGLRRAAEAVNADIIHIEPAPTDTFSWARPLWIAMRPYQWSKNALVFIPLMAGHFFTLPTVVSAILAFIAFSLLASATYLVNDLLDLDADRAHPRKRTRPFASGDAPIELGFIATPSLGAMAFLVALATLPITFVGALALYLIATLSYSLWLKRKVFVDIFALAALYTLRILAGAAAVGTNVSPWLLAFSMFFFLSLAVAKRLVELRSVIASDFARTKKRDYRVEDLGVVQAFGVASGYLSVLVLALYFNSADATTLYRSPEYLWGICPLLLFWISRMLILSNRGHLHDDPIVFTARDRTSYLVGLCATAVIAASLLL